MAGVQAELPRKTPKPVKPVRKGHIYMVRRGEDWLVENRPDKGLLGGMLGFPGSEWAEDPVHEPPLQAAWQDIGQVRHTFTHFHLILTVHYVPAPEARGDFRTIARADLPTVFRKALDLTLGRIADD
jgi:A/G-specific adenine glycosylase